MQPQQNESQNLKKPASSCPVCGGIYDPSVMFCPSDGSKLSDSLVDTERMIIEVKGFEGGEGAESTIGLRVTGEAARKPGGDTLVTGIPGLFEDDPSSRNDPRDMIGRIVDSKYRIESVLGEGGMSIVYKAWDIFLKKYVALKMLRPHMLNLSASMSRFQQEARAASNLSHANVVSVHSFGTPNGQAYLAMDYLNGEPLSDVIGEGKSLAINPAVHIFLQIADAMEHAHSKGVVHRDLKPSNVILVEQDGEPDFVKIVDFGIAKLLNAEGPEGVKLTQTGEIFGSPLYMSPEQSRGETLDARSDIYSMGCLMYEALSGYTPHRGENSLEIMYKHMNEVPHPIASDKVSKKIPSRLEKIIFKALAKDPNERYQTMRQMHQDLAAFIKEQKGSIFSKIQDRTELIWLKRRPKTVHEKTIATVCGVLILVVLGLSGYLVSLYLVAANSEGVKRRLEWIDPNVVMKLDTPSSERGSSLTIGKRVGPAPGQNAGLQYEVADLGFTSDPNQRANMFTVYGNKLLQSQKYLQALEAFKKAYGISIEANGEFAIPSQRIHVLLAECQFRTGDLPGARVSLEDIVKSARVSLFPLKIVAHDHYILGLIDYHDGKYLAAERHFRKALSMWNEKATSENLVVPELGTISYDLADVPPNEEYEMGAAKLGDVELKLKDFDSAYKCYSAAERYFSLETGGIDDFEKATSPGQELIDAGINRAIAFDRLAQVALMRKNKAAVTKNMNAAIIWMKRCAMGHNLALEGVVHRDYADMLLQLGDLPESAQQQILAWNIFARAR